MFFDFKKKKQLKYLRSIWGKQTTDYRNMDLIANFHRLAKQKKNGDYVDDKTWADLNMDDLFAKIDRNNSSIGQQYLYHLMHKYERDAKVRSKRTELTNNLGSDSNLRESVQLSLSNLKEFSSYFTSFILLTDNLPFTKYYKLFYLCAIASLFSILFITINKFFIFAAVCIAVLNLVLNKIYTKKIYEYFTGFSSLNSLLTSAIKISTINSDKKIDEIEFLREKKTVLKKLTKKLGYLVLDKAALPDMAVLAIEYLNMFLLFDIIAYFRSVSVLQKNQEDLIKVFECIGNLDASISLASYLTENGNYCTPIFNEEGKIEFEDLFHPLIDEPVSNSMKECKHSVLITGSNMAGKTTYIKTVGVNFILAQTLGFAKASRFMIPKYYVKTAIRRNDDLEEGKSYFFVEIEQLKEFIEYAVSGKKYLFLIDEIFRGTNTIERLAASSAVLKNLDKNNCVYVTTHDIELQEMLGEKFKMFHFSEQVEDVNFFFNYKLQEGPCLSGNAIKLLELMNYPKSITDEAKETIKEILKGK